MCCLHLNGFLGRRYQPHAKIVYCQQLPDGRWYWSGHRRNSQLAIDPATGTIATSAAYAIITATVIIAKLLLLRQPELLNFGYCSGYIRQMATLDAANIVTDNKSN